MTDLWSDDMREHYVAPDLPQTLAALRDGTAPEPAYAGLARQQRLAQMERDLAACGDFVDDCDRYSEFMRGLDSPCVHDHVPRMMGVHLLEIRAKALQKKRRLREDLAVLRRQA